MATSRIARELRKLTDAGCVIASNENGLRWTLDAAFDSVYFPATRIYVTLDIRFPVDYPFKPPEVSLVKATPSIAFLTNANTFMYALMHDDALEGCKWRSGRNEIVNILSLIQGWLEYCDHDLTTYNRRTQYIERDVLRIKPSPHVQPCECAPCKVLAKNEVE